MYQQNYAWCSNILVLHWKIIRIHSVQSTFLYFHLSKYSDSLTRHRNNDSIATLSILEQCLNSWLIPWGLGVEVDSWFDVVAAERGALITRCTARPSLMLWVLRVSWSFMILPAKIRHSWSTCALNFFETTSLNYRPRRVAGEKEKQINYRTAELTRIPFDSWRLAMRQT